MALRSKLAGEAADNAEATQAALHGRSLTGLSGRHSDAPIMGDLIQPPSPMAEDTSLAPRLREREPEPVRERVPFGTVEQTLAYPNRPGYRRYWFNDTPGRINRAKQAGYSHVIDPDTGNPVARITGQTEKGDGQNSFLMEIPMEWYQEDMERQAQERERALNDIRNGRAGQGADDNRYIPQSRGGIKIQGR